MAKTLIAYFSHAGQNYAHGGIRNLPVGNTEVVAKKLHAMLGGDLFYIDTVQKYPDDHMKKIAYHESCVAENDFQGTLYAAANLSHRYQCFPFDRYGPEAKEVCTNCGRCKAACPAGIDIPAVIGAYGRHEKKRNAA